MQEIDELRARVVAQYGEGIPAKSYRGERAPTPKSATAVPVGPITLRLPWSCLVSDNDKFVAFMRGSKPAIKITSAYATAKERIAGLARDVMGERAAFDVPLSFTARVWYPDKRARDLTNWCKLVHDALSTIVYADDSLLRDVRWKHAGVDVDAPRAEILITPHAA